MPVDHSSVTQLAQRLGSVPTELRRELRPKLRAVGVIISNDMKSRASYSTRIPGAISTTVSFAQKGGGVKIKVDARKAPHARVLERGNQRGRGTTFRHPVFGTDTWVSQPMQPFFFPAVHANRDRVMNEISKAVKASFNHL